MLVWLQSLLFLLRHDGVSSSQSSPLNVYNQTLQPCSTTSMAQTGYTRDGTCVDRSDDSGSHHICIDLSSATSDGMNFCQVTGQSNWCAMEMTCVGGEGNCPVVDWCVCQWAFASYIEAAGGCDAIQEIKCEAVNIKAVEAYRGSAKYADALACLSERCGL